MAVTLDAAGTLVTLREPVGVVYSRFADPFVAAERPPDPDDLEAAFHRHFRGMPPLAFPPLQEEELQRRERAWWRELLRRIAVDVERLPSPDHPGGWFDQLYDHYAGTAGWTAFDEVREVLARLGDAGLRLAVVTNFDSRVDSVLQDLELAPFLDAVVTSSRAGAAKPDPAIFHAATRRLDCRPGDVLHVGDRADLDVEAARAAGLQALLLRRSLAHALPGEQDTIADLRGLLDHLGLDENRRPAGD